MWLLLDVFRQTTPCSVKLKTKPRSESLIQVYQKLLREKKEQLIFSNMPNSLFLLSCDTNFPEFTFQKLQCIIRIQIHQSHIPCKISLLQLFLPSLGFLSCSFQKKFYQISSKFDHQILNFSNLATF